MTNVERFWAMKKHDVSGGGLCTDDGRGCCKECGVAMVKCPECNGMGYHFNGCVDGDEDISDCIDGMRAGGL